MSSKHYRVLIIDPVHMQAYVIEKMLNVMGHYCIASTKSAEEGLLLNRYGMKNFDVLITPLSVLIHKHCQVNIFKGFNIENLFLYSCSSSDRSVPIQVNGEACFDGGLPEYKALEDFMTRLPPLKRSCGPRLIEK